MVRDSKLTIDVEGVVSLGEVVHREWCGWDEANNAAVRMIVDEWLMVREVVVYNRSARNARKYAVRPKQIGIRL